MNELLEKIQENRLSPEHSEKVLSIIIEWVNENYPVAGTVATTWLQQQQASVEA